MEIKPVQNKVFGPGKKRKNRITKGDEETNNLIWQGVGESKCYLIYRGLQC